MFIDKGKNFREKIDYRNKMVGRMGIEDVRDIMNVEERMEKEEKLGEL